MNRNAGAESTIEALLTLIELREIPQAMKWIHAKTIRSGTTTRNGKTHHYKLFEVGSGTERRQAALLIDLESSTFTLQQGTSITL